MELNPPVMANKWLLVLFILSGVRKGTSRLNFRE
jgi:hypothetical protein